jgi:probable poly-beta-1,6-N-acetyl-D-glucosamine export protein
LKEGFLHYIHHYRGLAIVLIVAVHCRMAFPWPEDSVVHEVLFYGLNSSTILFVFISGFLFAHLNAQRFDFKTYLLQKLKFVLVPYALISIPALLDKLLFEQDAAWMDSFYRESNSVYQVIYMLVTGKHSGPFYFIPTIFAMYLLAPLFLRLLGSRFFTPLAVLIISGGFFCHQYGYYATLGESIVYFIPVYVFGMWISSHKDKILNFPLWFWLSLAGLYSLIFLLEVTQTIQSFRLNGFGQVHYWQAAFNWGKLKEMTLALLLTGIFYRLRDRKFELLETLGYYSFGIYFIHIYFINATEKTVEYFHGNLSQNLGIFLMFTVAVIAASAGSIHLVKKITGKNSRWLTGS